MISINTNLSSLIAQQSLKQSSNKLNLAVERMSTGFKINHAKDNAANYSISTNMTTKIGAYQVAEDNVAMGLDLLSTANDTLAQMQDKASRLQALSTQARNGTYGTQSLSAIKTEAGAIINEIRRLYKTAEYNKIKLLDKKEYQLSAQHEALTEEVSAKAEYGGFIVDPKSYEDTYVNNLTSVTSAINGAGLEADKEYKVSTVKDLQALAEFVNNNGDTTNMTFILANDIDLASVDSWTPIGNSTNKFNGHFNGNGHLIKNLTINKPIENNLGLFGRNGTSSSIKNLGVVNVNIKGTHNLGGIVGISDSYIGLKNVFVTGCIEGQYAIGGLAGSLVNDTYLENSYANIIIHSSDRHSGGLFGVVSGPPTGIKIRNCMLLEK